MKDTLYRIKINEGLLWDYEFSEEQYKTKEFFTWYLSRVLNNGNSNDLKTIPLNIIKKNLQNLNLSKKIRDFWEWFFQRENIDIK